MSTFLQWEIMPKPTKQQRRVAKARAWRNEHLRSAEVGWRLWDGGSRYSRKVHLPAPMKRRYLGGETLTMCGRFTLFESYPTADFGMEFDGCAAEWPEVPYEDQLCKHCRAAVKRLGTHPFRRRRT